MKNRATFLVSFGLSMVAGSVYVERAGLMVPPDAPPSNNAASLPADERRMRAMLAADVCWTGGEGRPLPTRVWLRHIHPDNSDRYYKLHGQKQVAAALDQIFGDADTDLDIVAFCV